MTADAAPIEGELIPALSAHEARLLSSETYLVAKDAASTYRAWAKQFDKLQELLLQASRGQAYAALGFKSHLDYVAEFSGPLLYHAGVAQRQAMVALLTSEGASVRWQAEKLGVSVGTIHRDKTQVFKNGTPAEESQQSTTSVQPDGETEGIVPLRKPPEVIGRDGKRHPSTKPKAPPRKSTTDPHKPSTAEDDRLDARSKAKVASDIPEIEKSAFKALSTAVEQMQQLGEHLKSADDPSAQLRCRDKLKKTAQC